MQAGFNFEQNLNRPIMKNIFLFLCCTLFVPSLFAQNTTTWFPPGAKWQFDYESISGPGVEILEHVGTTVIDGHLCTKLHWYGYNYGAINGPVDYGYEYLYAENDSVFLSTDVGFVMLYDFTRQVGDTIIPPNSLYNFGIIDSTGTTAVLGIPVRFQDISLFSYNIPDIGHSRVYERLGGQHLVYWDIESPITEIQYDLACYRDDEYPNTNCNFSIIATSNLNDISDQIKLYPNPATDLITLELPIDIVPAIVRLFDAQGRELGQRKINETTSRWSLSDLSASKVLFLHFQTFDGKSGTKIVRVE